MSTQTAKNNLSVLIGKSLTRQTGASATFDPNGTGVQCIDSSAAGFIQDGEIVVLDNLGRALGVGATIADSPQITLVQRSGSALFYSPRIQGALTTSYTGRSGAQGQEQIYCIGYDGVTATNAIDVTALTDAYLNITYTMDEGTQTYTTHKRPYLIPISSTATTNVLAARSIAEQVSKASARGAENVKVEMMNSSTTTVAGAGTATTLTVANGSDIAQFNGTETTAIAVGIYIRIGTSGAGVGITQPVYYVVATNSTDSNVPANAVRLNMVYQGPSYASTWGTDSKVLTPSTVWGVKFTGQYLSEYNVSYIKFLRTSFKMSLVGMGATQIVRTQEATYGYGDGRKVAEIENFARGYDGILNRMSIPLATFPNDAVNTSSTAATGITTASTLYDTISINCFSRNEQGGVTPSTNQPMEIQVFVVDGSNQRINILGQLNSWMESCPRAFSPIVTL